MKYKISYQFRWLLVIGLILAFFLSSLILIKLPFFSLRYEEKEVTGNILDLLLSFFPTLTVEFQAYNLQTILIWSSGILFGSRLSLIAVLIYLFIGLCGVPIFAGGGGIDYFHEPTFGYVISLPLLTYLSGYFFSKDKKIQSVLFPILAVHLLGIIYLFIFKQSHLSIAWTLSFSMIGYDLFFAFLLIPILPVLSFILNEMFIQEIPVRELPS